jgi:DNA-binding NarL/FixJ family response regulator
MPDKEIATLLKISVKTVKKHLTHVWAKSKFEGRRNRIKLAMALAGTV